MRAFLEELASCTDEANVARLTLCGCLSEASSANVPWHRATEDAMADLREASRTYIMCCLALTLFVFRVFANNHYATVSLDDLALVAHWLYRCSYFHFIILQIGYYIERAQPPEIRHFFITAPPL